jgi:hnRNP-L/PTB/hephaestus splicing factor
MESDLEIEHKPHENKKLKSETINEASSKVLHLRGIAPQLTDTEVLLLGLNFGNLKNVLFLKAKGQAFLDFENLEDAMEMVNFFRTNNTSFFSKRIFAQYSTHQELTTDPNNSNNQTATTLLREASDLYNISKKGGKNTVLRITIVNNLYPVNLEALHQIFSKFGLILKIITFTKNNQYQALIQMKDSQIANNAKNGLDGKNIYNGCCRLQIEFSKLASLEVKFNNDKSRDYTSILLPTGEIKQTQENCLLSESHLINSQLTASHHFGNSQLQANHFNNSQLSLFSGPSSIENRDLGMHMQNKNELTSPVVLVTNLNEQFATPDALFTLFGVYGDVIRVKILFNKKDSALINFVNNIQASTALDNLDNFKLWTKQIRVFPSKHASVQMPKDEKSDSGLTKDFSNSPLHRFKKPGSKNFNNIFPPSATLHLSNIPTNVQEQDFYELFSKYGTVKGFRFFQNDHKMALIQMSSTDEGINALIGTHNHQLAENMHLRVAFSKLSTI